MNPSNGGWAIFLSLLVAMLLGVVHLPESWPAWLGWLRPNWLLLAILFWVIDVPHRLGLIAVWCVGLAADVLYAQPLGLNAFIMAAVTYVGWRFYERLRMYSVLQTAGLAFLLVLGGEICRVLVLGLDGARQWTWAVLLAPLMTALAWPLLWLVLTRVRTGLRIE